MPWENIGLFPTSLSLEGSWIGSICKVKQALLNNPFHTQCCRAFRLHLRPAGGDLKQIFTSLSSSSNTPREPKDSHLDATWTQTKVRWRYLCTVGWCLHSVVSAPCTICSTFVWSDRTRGLECKMPAQNYTIVVASRNVSKCPLTWTRKKVNR